jgi:hypothetical protein
VLSEIAQHVPERVPHFARSFQIAPVVPSGEDGATAPKDAIDRPRDANGEPLNAAREHHAVRGFDDEVQMIALHGVVKEPERAVGRAGERVAHFNVQSLLAE